MDMHGVHDITWRNPQGLDRAKRLCFRYQDRMFHRSNFTCHKTKQS